MLTEYLNWVFANRENIKIFYGLIIALICFVITHKTHRLYRLSLHQGIRYFRNAFFFYGIGFTIRYLFGSSLFTEFSNSYFLIVRIIFAFFLIMAGFFLLYSLIWKKIEFSGKEYTSSLLNSKIAVFYFMSILIVILDNIWQNYYFMFSSQIILFTIAIFLSFINYKNRGSKHKFLKFYFIAMILSFLAWILNALAPLFFNWNCVALIIIYSLNTIIFLLFLWGVMRITKKINK